MASLMISLLIMILFGVHDLTKETDEIYRRIARTSKSISQSNSNISLTKITLRFDFILLIISSAYLNFLACGIELVINLTGVDTFKWSLTRLALVNMICTIIYTICMFTIANRIIKRYVQTLYYMSFFMNAVVLILLVLPTMIDFKTLVQQHSHFITCNLINIFAGLSMAVLARTLLFRMVPSEWGSYCEGIRSFFSRIFGIVAFFSAAWIYEYLKMCAPLLSIVSLLFIAPLSARKRFRPPFCCT